MFGKTTQLLPDLFRLFHDFLAALEKRVASFPQPDLQPREAESPSFAEELMDPSPPDPNVRVMFSARSHLSGISVRFDLGDYQDGIVRVDLFALDNNHTAPVRTAMIDLSKFDSGETEHLYWEPLEESKDRSYLVRFGINPGSEHRGFAPPRLLAAKLIHSQPDGYESLPQAVLWSPVSQCNLSCTHCISRPTRKKLRVASQRTWDAIWQITRGEKFSHLAMDYSGDILFSERRYPGTLAKTIALNAKYRLDTNANYLDDAMTDVLLASRLYEINFSIDSMDPEVYRRIRRGCFPLPEVLGNIERFMARKREAKIEMCTIISFVLMRSNAATIKPAIAFARDHGIDYVNVVPIMAFTEEMVKEIFHWDEVAYAALYEELTTEAKRLGVSLSMQLPVKRWRDEDLHAPCEVPFTTAVITANGDVWACCMPGAVMGNLNEQSLCQIWNGPAFASFRKRVNSSDPPAPCRNCGLSRVHNNRRAYAPVRYSTPRQVEWLKYSSGS